MELTKNQFQNLFRMIEVAEPEVIKAVVCSIPLGESALDAYMLPNGEKRLGVESVSQSLGYSKRWFYNRTKRQSKWLEGLQGKGFTGAQLEVRILRQEEDKTVRGASLSKTISVRDFTKVVAYEAILNRNKKAITLMAALMETGLERVLEDAFAGRSIIFLLEKIVHFTQWTYEELQEVLAYNREEVKALYPWGARPDLTGRRDHNLS